MKHLLSVLLLLCLLTGCGEAPSSPAPEPDSAPVSPVYTDWSQLTPYSPEEAEAQYTCFEPYSGSGTLQARNDYGLLLPYIGAELVVDNYIAFALPLYGLATADGQVVTEPVYAGISMENGFLLLYRGEGTARHKEVWGSWVEGGFHLTVAAPDGSWVREVDGYEVCSIDGLLATADRGALSYWNTQGELVRSFSADIFEPYFGDDFIWNGEGGPWLDHADSRVAYVTSNDPAPDGDQRLRLYLDLEQGTVRKTPPDGYPEEIDYESFYEEEPEFPGYRHSGHITDPVTGQRYYPAHTDTEGPSEYHLLSESGEVLLTDFDNLWVSFPQIIDGRIACVEDQDGYAHTMAGGTFRWRRLDTGECVFQFPIRTNSD